MHALADTKLVNMKLCDATLFNITRFDKKNKFVDTKLFDTNLL
jgi:hypothetical protein